MTDEKPKSLADAKAEFIFETKQYMDNNGRAIIERTAVSGKMPPDFVRFIMPASMQEMTPMGPMQWQFEIPLLGATTPKEAFDLLSQEAPKAVEKAKEELKKFVMDKMMEAEKHVQVASDLPPSLLGGDGKVLGLPGSPPRGRGDPRDFRRKKRGR